MRKWFLCAVAALLCAPFASAQFTAVSANVKDSNGNVYAGCRGDAVFVPNPAGTTQPLLGGSVFPTDVVIAQCDAFGGFTLNLADVAQVTPSGGTWKFNLRASDGTHGFSYTAPICPNAGCVTGSSLNITSAIQTVAPLLSPLSNPLLNCTPTSVVFSATETFDASSFCLFQLTLTGNVTSSTIINPVSGRVIQFEITQNGTGGNTFAWPASVLNPPTICSAANCTSRIELRYNGTNWVNPSDTISNATFTGAVLCKTLENMQCVDLTLSRGGADGCDELNKAYAAAAPNQDIYISAGTFNVTTACNFSTNLKNVRIHGAGQNLTVINWAASTGTVLTLDTGNATGVYSTVSDLTINCTNGSNTATGISTGPVNGLKWGLIARVSVSGCLVPFSDSGLLTQFIMDEGACGNTAASSAFKLTSTGDSAHWVSGSLAGCSKLLDNSSPSNGPVVFSGTQFNPPSANETAVFALTNEVDCTECHITVGAGFPAAVYWNLTTAFAQMKYMGGTIEDDRTSGSASTCAASNGNVYLSGVTLLSGFSTGVNFCTFSGSATAQFRDVAISAAVYTGLWNTAYTGGQVNESGTRGAPSPVADTIPYAITFQQNFSAPSSTTPTFYNESGVGPAISGAGFRVRAQASIGDAFDVTSSGNTQIKGVLQVASTIQNTAATATMGLTLKKGSGGGNYTNATTSYTVADSTNLCFTVTIPTGWKLGVSASGALSTATAAVVAQAALTDNAACSTANAGILVETAPIQGAGIGIADAFALNWVITGDGASHNIALQFKTSNAADAASLINSSATITPTIKFELMPSN